MDEPKLDKIKIRKCGKIPSTVNITGLCGTAAGREPA